MRRNIEKESRLNPYSNGTMYLIHIENSDLVKIAASLNPYSNGTMYLIGVERA